jgi:hypothetical protein
MPRMLLIGLVAWSGTVVWGQDNKTVANPGAITAEEFKSLHAQLRKRDKWETVDWRTDLHETRAASIKEKKPIFIWAMDGQTLGCT